MDSTLRTLLVAVFLSAGACAEATAIGDDDGAGGAGEGAAAPSGSSSAKTAGSGATTSATSTVTAAVVSSTQAASVAASTSSSGGSTCDGSLDCGTCQTCAMQGPCVNQYVACTNSPPCTALNDCLNACPPGDQPCLDGCAATYPEGAPLLQAAATCVFCTACYSDCDGASIGCP
jgi:hypothetical protein